MSRLLKASSPSRSTWMFSVDIVAAQRPHDRSGRTAIKETTLGGQVIRRGEAVIPILPAANRDPRQFPDAEKFQIDREPNRQLALGIGIHVCIGAALARLETEIAFSKLLARFPGLRRSGQAQWNSSFELRGRTVLPVAF